MRDGVHETARLHGPIMRRTPYRRSGSTLQRMMQQNEMMRAIKR